MSIKQTEIGTIHSLKNCMYIFFLPTESVIVAHPVEESIIYLTTVYNNTCTEKRFR
jgi:hypothetical protein